MSNTTGKIVLHSPTYLEVGSSSSQNTTKINFNSTTPTINFPQISSSPVWSVSKNEGEDNSTYCKFSSSDNNNLSLIIEPTYTDEYEETTTKPASLIAHSDTGDLEIASSSGAVRTGTLACRSFSLNNAGLVDPGEVYRRWFWSANRIVLYSPPISVMFSPPFPGGRYFFIEPDEHTVNICGYRPIILSDAVQIGDQPYTTGREFGDDVLRVYGNIDLRNPNPGIAFNYLQCRLTCYGDGTTNELRYTNDVATSASIGITCASGTKAANLTLDSANGNLSLSCTGNTVVMPNARFTGTTSQPAQTLTIPAGAGPFNNVALPNGSCVMITNNANAGSSISGFAAGSDGARVTLVYSRYGTSTKSLTILHDSALSNAASRVLMQSGADLILNPTITSTVEMVYNTTIGRWLVLNH